MFENPQRIDKQQCNAMLSTWGILEKFQFRYFDNYQAHYKHRIRLVDYNGHDRLVRTVHNFKNYGNVAH